MKKNLVSFSVALVAAAAATAPALAQTCAGYPTGMMGLYFGGRADFPEGASSYGAEAAFNAPGPLGVHGGVNVISPDGEDDSRDFFFGGASLDIASISTPIVGPSVSVCPVVEAHFSSGDDVSTLDVPVGLGVGASLGIPGIAAHAYAQPRAIFSRISSDNPLLDDDSETNFGLKLGGSLGLGLITVGAELNHVFRDEADPTFGIRAGIRL